MRNEVSKLQNMGNPCCQRSNMLIGNSWIHDPEIIGTLREQAEYKTIGREISRSPVLIVFHFHCCLPQPACRLSCSVWMHPSSLIPLARAPTPTRSLATCSAWASWRAERTPARWVSVLLPHPGLLFSTWVSLFWNTQECMSIPGLMERDEVQLWVNHRVSFCDINCLSQL